MADYKSLYSFSLPLLNPFAKALKNSFSKLSILFRWARLLYIATYPSLKTPKQAGIEMTTSTGTVRIHRVFSAPAERVYRAFLDADATAKWLPPYGFTCKVHHLDAKVGGTFRMSFTNFSAGTVNSFGGEYLELVPNELIRYTDKFDDPNLPGEIVATIRLKSVAVGTEVHIEQTGLPSIIPVEACYLGWQESLMQLANLVQPQIPDGSC